MTSTPRVRTRALLRCIALASLHLSPAYAQAGWYVAPEASFFYPDQTAYDESDASLGINAGLALSGGRRLELGYHALELVPESRPGLAEQKSVQLVGYADGRPLGLLSPYFGFGLGASRVELSGGISTLPFASVSAGLSVPLLESGRLRLDSEARARYSYDDDRILGERELVDGQFLLKLRYHFSRVKPAAVRMDRETGSGAFPDGRTPSTSTPADRDDDGVSDLKDRCPNTIPGVRVDTDGCMVGN